MSDRDERWVNGPRLIRVLKSSLRDTREQANETRERAVISRVEAYVMRQPDQPHLVGVTEAARILKVPKPRIIRFRQQGRLPEPLRVDGPSPPMYVRSEIEAFAKTVEEAREERRTRVAEAA